jgi:hypothetical protein
MLEYRSSGGTKAHSRGAYQNTWSKFLSASPLASSSALLCGLHVKVLSQKCFLQVQWLVFATVSVDWRKSFQFIIITTRSTIELRVVSLLKKYRRNFKCVPGTGILSRAPTVLYDSILNVSLLDTVDHGNGVWESACTLVFGVATF